MHWALLFTVQGWNTERCDGWLSLIPTKCICHLDWGFICHVSSVICVAISSKFNAQNFFFNFTFVSTPQHTWTFLKFGKICLLFFFFSFCWHRIWYGSMFQMTFMKPPTKSSKDWWTLLESWELYLSMHLIRSTVIHILKDTLKRAHLLWCQSLASNIMNKLNAPSHQRTLCKIELFWVEAVHLLEGNAVHRYYTSKFWKKNGILCIIS